MLKLISKANNTVLKATLLLAFSLSSMSSISASVSSYVPEHRVYEPENKLHEHKIVNLLNSKLQNEGTIATIPYVSKNNDIYILLGRTKVNNNNKNKAGKYTSLGGKIKTSATILENLQPRLQEESMGMLFPNAEYVINHSIILDRENIGGRQAIYNLLHIEPSMYISAEQLNEHRYSKKDMLSNSELRKDEFNWFKLDDLIQLAKGGQLTGKISDIEGKKLEISLQKYFVDNFLLNDELAEIKWQN